MGNEGETILAMLEGLNSKFDDLDLKFELLDTKFEALDNKYEASDSRFEMFDDKFERFESSVANVHGTMEQLEQKTDEVHAVCSAVQQVFQEELNGSMHAIAKAFQGMERKLEEAVRVKAENEVLRMRMEQLENEVQKIKEHLGI